MIYLVGMFGIELDPTNTENDPKNSESNWTQLTPKMIPKKLEKNLWSLVWFVCFFKSHDLVQFAVWYAKIESNQMELI